jgi:hypothetical protein
MTTLPDLASATTIADADLFITRKDGDTVDKKVTAAVLKTYTDVLTFSTGLTRATNTITANLSTGVAGGQSVIGGTAANEDLTIEGTNHATKTTSYVALQPNGGSVAVGKLTADYKLDVYGTNAAGAISANMGYNIARVATPPATMTRTPVAGSGLEIGTYYYRVIFYNAVGDSTPSAAMAVTTTAGNQQVNLSTIPISSDPTVIGRKIYRSRVADGASYGGLIATIADNTTTTYTDTTPDASVLPAAAGARSIYAKANTSTNYISVDGVRSMILDESLTTFGYNAGAAVTVGANNTLFGVRAGEDITFGSGNTLFGANAGSNITSGSDNMLFGPYTMNQGTTANYNIAIGPHNLYSLVTGSHNISAGYYTGYRVTGSNNTYIGGYIAVSGTWSGSNNIAIGQYCEPLLSTGSNQLNIGHLIYGTGVNSTSKKVFTRAGSAQSGNMFEWQNSAGTVLSAVDAVGKIGAGVSSPTALNDIGASTTSRASLRLRSGVAPTSPNSGDIWYDGGALRLRNASVTEQIATSTDLLQYERKLCHNQYFSNATQYATDGWEIITFNNTGLEDAAYTEIVTNDTIIIQSERTYIFTLGCQYYYDSNGSSAAGLYFRILKNGSVINYQNWSVYHQEFSTIGYCNFRSTPIYCEEGDEITFEWIADTNDTYSAIINFSNAMSFALSIDGYT